MANNTTEERLADVIIQFWQYERTTGLIIRIDAILLTYEGIYRTVNSQLVDWTNGRL